MIAPVNAVRAIDSNRLLCDPQELVATVERYTMPMREFVFIKYAHHDLIVFAELMTKESNGQVLFGNYILCNDNQWEDGSGLRAEYLVDLLPKELLNAKLVESFILTE